MICKCIHDYESPVGTLKIEMPLHIVTFTNNKLSVGPSDEWLTMLIVILPSYDEFTNFGYLLIVGRLCTIVYILSRCSVRNGLRDKPTPGMIFPVTILPPGRNFSVIHLPPPWQVYPHSKKRTRLLCFSHTLKLNTFELIWIILECFSDRSCVFRNTCIYERVWTC